MNDGDVIWSYTMKANVLFSFCNRRINFYYVKIYNNANMLYHFTSWCQNNVTFNIAKFEAYAFKYNLKNLNFKILFPDVGKIKLKRDNSNILLCLDI